MSEIKNIRGEFKITLAGQERTLKSSFDVIEKLETQVLNKGIFETLQQAMANKAKFSDMVSVIHQGLVAAKDTRLSRAEVGAAMVDAGMVTFMQTYIEFLTYCITGGREAKEGAPGE